MELKKKIQKYVNIFYVNGDAENRRSFREGKGKVNKPEIQGLNCPSCGPPVIPFLSVSSQVKTFSS